MNLIKSKWSLYVISGILWDVWDISYNMKKFLEKTDLLFVEEITLFHKFINENKILFKGELIEMTDPFEINKFKKNIIAYLLNWKNVGIFESWGTACLVDPWYWIVNFAYELKGKIDFNIVPIPWTWAIPTWISVPKCFWLYT